MLLELIEILRQQNGETWQAIIRIAANKSAAIAIDDTRIYVQVAGEQNLQITISEAEVDMTNSFESSGQTLAKIMFGKSTIEKSVASGKIFINTSFGDLLKIRAIVTSVLLDAKVNIKLQELWIKFDQEWN
jgi:hypothetical protein